MRQPRLSGPGAGSDKYDLLTALSVAALAQGGQLQISLLRLMALVTARYNWANDELSLGQREMAQLWSVEERTAKREVKRLIDLGLLVLQRRGVKGRVASYRLSFETLCAMTSAHWPRVGRDFEDRMHERHRPQPAETPAAETPRVVRVDFAARQKLETPVEAEDLPETAAPDPWGRSLQRLQRADPARHAAWFAALQPVSQDGGVLQIRAPSVFAAQYIATHFLGLLEAACRAEFGQELRCQILADR